MARALLTCKYCDYKFEVEYYSIASAQFDRCKKCGDKNLKIEEITKSKIDYYEGCPPFQNDDDGSYFM